MRSVHADTQHTPLKFINLALFIMLRSTQCTESCQNCIHRQCVFFFGLPNLEDLPFDATSSHAFACYCIEQQQTIPIKNCSLFWKRCVIELPCMLDMYGFFSLLCLKMSFLSDDSSMASILHLWPPHFFGTATKKCQDFPPLDIHTCAFQLCWSAPPSAVIRLQWMPYALMEVDLRGSWCEGGREKELTSPLPESLVCCLKPILLFNDIPLCIWIFWSVI